MSEMKKIANKILSTLDSSADMIDSLQKSGKIDAKIASDFTSKLDAFADRIQIAAFGEESFRKFQAKVIRRDPDEKFMDTFENVNKPIQTEADEPYMHETGKTFNGKGAPTFDADGSSVVQSRPEYDVRDLSELSDKTKKQPSWDKGPAGKSTHQGSTAPKTEKTWSA